MAQSIGPRIPGHILALLSGDALERHVGITFLLLSGSAEGWPHLAMLSVGEVLALDERHLHLALWPASTATDHLSRSGRATLALVHAGAGYSIRLSVRRASDLVTQLSGRLARFECVAEDILEDIAPYAVLEAGVRYRLKDPVATVYRWQEVISALRA